MGAFYRFGDFENYKVVILGDGQEKENLEELIKKLKIEKHIYLNGLFLILISFKRL